MNRYAYAYNNPLRITDPTGEWGFDTIKKAVGSAASVVKGAAVWVYHNPDIVAATLGTAALVATPAGLPFLVLTAGAVAFGALDTYRSCKGGVTVGCGVSAVTTVASAGTAKWARVASRGVEATEVSLKAATVTEKVAQSSLTASQTAPARLRGWAQATIPQFARLADTAAGRGVGQVVSRAERFRLSVAQQQAARAAAASAD